MGMRDPSPLAKIIVQAYLPADPTIAVIGGGNGHSGLCAEPLLRLIISGIGLSGNGPKWERPLLCAEPLLRQCGAGAHMTPT